MDYSIVVVTWECAGYLTALVDSMNRHLSSEPELVVVDNASSDDPEAAARRWRGVLRFEQMNSNRGYGAAANAGVVAAQTETVVLLNPDTELTDEGLDRLAEFAQRRDALAGPRVVEPSGAVEPSASGPPVGVWPWIGAILPGAALPLPMKVRTEPWRLSRTVKANWLSGACVAAQRQTLLSLGPFDPAIHLYGEDMDLGLRAGAARIPSYFCPDLCEIVHHGRGSTSVRWSKGPAAAIEANARAVVKRAYGTRRERRAWRAHKLHLWMRVMAKRLTGRDPDRQRDLLEAARRAEPVAELPSPPPAPR